MKAELCHPRHRDGWVRIHDAGDFFAEWYLLAWCRIAAEHPDVTFYAYTKEVTMTRKVRAEDHVPENLLIVFSLGGKEDHLIDLARERHADVFPDVESIIASGYYDQSADDRLAVLGPERVGIPANNLKHLRKRQGPSSFGDLQREHDSKKVER